MIGVLAIAVMRLVVLVARLVGNMSIQLGYLMINLYDIIVCVPLWLEQRIKHRMLKNRAHENPKDQADVEPSTIHTATQADGMAQPNSGYRDSNSSIIGASI